MKVIAFYLPQFHSIPENDMMWGKGFTEWVNVKKSKPLFKGHYQPRKPLNDNYYNLLDDDIKKWQVNLAKEHGIYGFCFYHYWFNGKKLLEKPVEQFLNNSNLDISFCLSWANEAWSKAWVSKSDEVLYEQEYGNEKNWEEHFTYLLPFFKDKRYIKENNKPLFIIYRPELIDCLNEMLDYLDKRAKECGFSGIAFAYQHVNFYLKKNKDDSRFSYNIEYEPAYSMSELRKDNKTKTFLLKFGKFVDKICMNLFNKTLSEFYLKKVRKFSYSELWEKNIERVPCSKKSIPGIFVDWDNTPRRGTKGSVAIGASPDKFKKYLSMKLENIQKYYSAEYIFIFAWNEWAEGGYLEPDEKFQYGYLEALKEVLENKRWKK